MLVNDFHGVSWNGDLRLNDPSWLSGAKAGLLTLNGRSPTWKWDEFLSDLREMIEFADDILPTNPGEAPILDGGFSGSILTALGGYISVTGYLLDDGLFFRVSPEYQEGVRIALSGLEVFPFIDGLLVDKSDLSRLINLLDIQGPLEDILKEEGI